MASSLCTPNAHKIVTQLVLSLSVGLIFFHPVLIHYIRAVKNYMQMGYSFKNKNR